MSSLKSDDRYLRHELARLCQGDILRDIEVAEWAGPVLQIEGGEGELTIRRRQLQYAVVMSQECDLYQDQQNRSNAQKNQDKYLHSVLVVPAYPALTLKQGTHLQGLKVTCETLGGDRWKQILRNGTERYHHLPEWPSLQVPELVLDFKHFLTSPREDLLQLAKGGAYLASLGQLFRERLSQRFANFLARIALPDLNEENQDSQKATG
jgi:hypothetical protein